MKLWPGRIEIYHVLITEMRRGASFIYSVLNSFVPIGEACHNEGSSNHELEDEVEIKPLVGE